MAVSVTSWEYPLLARAYEALNTPWSAPHAHAPGQYERYKKAYSYCAHIVKTNSRTFAMAAALLSAQQRHAVHALYAFCRASDDILDKAPRGQDVSQSLIQWRVRVQSYPNPYDPVLLAWADTQARYQIPHGYVTQLIDGIARDLDQQRYRTFAELTEYCYGVASTVGLMVMHIIGFQSASAVPYAIKLGVALQLTNILRDVGADWQAGRLYLPQDELAQFGLTEDDIAQFASGNWDEHSHERWRALMRHQIQRTRRLYHEAQPGIALLHPKGRLAIQAAAGLYEAILDNIEAHDYDVFRRRAHVGFWGKIAHLPALWWKSVHVTLPE
jgi:15-cis-phytoene synthase